MNPMVIEATASVTFDEFFGAEYPKLVRLLYGMCARWALAEELAQESLLAAHRQWPKVSGFERPDLWLRRVAMNRAVSAHRRLLAEAAALVRVRSLTSVVVQPDDAADEEVWRSVARLPRRQAAALVLSAVEGYTFEEVGLVLVCSPETARTHVRRARERLRTVIDREEA
ncbi:MAG: putative polymerase subfamily sigma factor [Ilumatobacteraceae bacterium]|nr:putative polymerase subfamily sigma factor [Ilumatobacteraceae bacterium]